MAMINDDEIEHIYLDDEDSRPEKPTGDNYATESKTEHKKFYRLLIGILVLSTFLTIIRGWELTRWLADFLAVFLITFAALKFNDIERFAHDYRNYDALARNFRPLAYIFPFIETFLGFWYLLSEAPLRLNLFTMLISGTVIYSVKKALNDRSSAQSTAYSSFIRLPLTKVSLFENKVKFSVAFLLAILSFLHR